jgi:hypothetical protein
MAAAGKAGAETRLRDAVSGSGLTGAVMLRPSAKNQVDGLGQIFESIDPARLTADTETAPAGLVTCWGSGGVNVMRASRASLALVAGAELNALQIGRAAEGAGPGVRAGRTGAAVAVAAADR